MGFQMMYRRPFGDNEQPFVYVATDDNGDVLAEPWDNGLDHRVTFRSIDVSYKPKGEKNFRSAYKVFNEDFDFYVTESRLIFKLRSLKRDLKFRGSFIGYGVEAIMKKIEDKDVDRQNILGQLRYEWLMDIMYFEKTGWKDDNMLRFTYVDSDRTVWTVNLTFDKNMDVKFLANEILHMACRYKAGTKNDKSDDLVSFLEKYKTAEIPHVSEPKRFSVISFPSMMMACYGETKRPDLPEEE